MREAKADVFGFTHFVLEDVVTETGRQDFSKLPFGNGVSVVYQINCKCDIDVNFIYSFEI